MYGETNVEQAKSPIFFLFVFAVGALVHGKPEQAPQESASAQGRKPAVNEPDTTGASCHVDFGEGEIANCLYQTATRQLLVAPGFAKYGFANRIASLSVFRREAALPCSPAQVRNSPPKNFCQFNPCARLHGSARLRVVVF
jgi:hypothetical protein